MCDVTSNSFGRLDAQSDLCPLATVTAEETAPAAPMDTAAAIRASYAARPAPRYGVNTRKALDSGRCQAMPGRLSLAALQSATSTAAARGRMVALRVSIAREVEACPAFRAMRARDEIMQAI